MTDISYFVEEKLNGEYRGFAATVLNDCAIFTLTFNTDVHIEISLDELNFITRAAGNLPNWLRQADGVTGPTRYTNGTPISQSTVKAATAQPAPAAPATSGTQAVSGEEARAPRHGKRWAEDEDKKLLAAFRDAQQSVLEISRAFGRSPSSIVSRLLHLDAIEIIPKR